MHAVHLHSRGAGDRRQLKILASTLGNLEERRALMLAVAHGAIVSVIDRVFRFRDALEALDTLHQGRQAGVASGRMSGCPGCGLTGAALRHVAPGVRLREAAAP